MTREQLEHAIRAAGAICDDRELYIVGSQAILGSCRDAHPDLVRSMEVDIGPKNVYRPGEPVQRLDNPTELSGDPLLPGFSLSLIPIWDPDV
jgi:hypothetical protein